VAQPVVVTRLGVFDSGARRRAADGPAVQPRTQLELASLSFAAGPTGTLIDGSRFLPLATPVVLPAGFHGTVVARATAHRPNGNFVAQPITWSTNDGGGCSTSSHLALRASQPGAFPTNPR